MLMAGLAGGGASLAGAGPSRGCSWGLPLFRLRRTATAPTAPAATAVPIAATPVPRVSGEGVRAWEMPGDGMWPWPAAEAGVAGVPGVAGVAEADVSAGLSNGLTGSLKGLGPLLDVFGGGAGFSPVRLRAAPAATTPAAAEAGVRPPLNAFPVALGVAAKSGENWVMGRMLSCGAVGEVNVRVMGGGSLPTVGPGPEPERAAAPNGFSLSKPVNSD